MHSKATIPDNSKLKKIFFQRGQKKEKKRKEKHYSKHKIICMIENRQSN